MAVQGQKNKKSQPDKAEQVESQTIVFKGDKVDRRGEAWAKSDVWLRKDYLNKLKVIAHFEGVSIGELINRALGEFVAHTYDKSRSLKKLVTESTRKIKKVKI